MEDDLLDQKKEQEEKLLILAVSVCQCVSQYNIDVSYNQVHKLLISYNYITL